MGTAGSQFPNIAQIPVQPRLYLKKPVVLEIEYVLPASFTEGGRLLWRTTLVCSPLPGEVFLGRIRWQVGLPYSWVALVPGGNLEYRWGLQGWLLGPEPSVSSADLESWLTGREPKDSPMPISLTLAQTGQDDVQLFHLSP